MQQETTNQIIRLRISLQVDESTNGLQRQSSIMHKLFLPFLIQLQVQD